jgi:N6-adenosine-specific RNA methylase IME4
MATRIVLRHGKDWWIVEQFGRKGKLKYLKKVGSLPEISKERAKQELLKWNNKLETKPIYRTIVIDPPWPMEKIKREVRPNQIVMDYKTMSIDEIKKFPIKDFISPRGCHLYMWTTQKFLQYSFDILKEWNFNYIFTMVWHKPGGFQPVGLPQYNCEFVLFGKNGTLSFSDLKEFSVCFDAPRKEHSRKPDEFYNIVRRVSPEPRIDIFSREKREGFEQWGHESDKF